MSQLFAQSGLGTAQAFMAAARDPEAIKAIDPAADTLEGYLFPDTYSLPRQIDGEAMVARMVRRFATVFDEDMRRRATATGLSVRQIMAIAAAGGEGDGARRGAAAGRGGVSQPLRIGMPMQADPTVIYALKRAGRWNGNIRKSDLRLRLAVQHLSLPGPAARADRLTGQGGHRGRRSRPAKVDYLYFVSRNDGSHAFAATLARAQSQRPEVAGRLLQERADERRTSNVESQSRPSEPTRVER